jgi:hypothetical protein
MRGSRQTGKPWRRSLEALTAAGAEKVFQEKASGARGDRPQLAKMLASVKAGDTVLVTRLDRLARSTRDLLNALDQVRKAGAGFRFLADAWADTTTPHGRLMLTVLGGLAEFERELIQIAPLPAKAPRPLPQSGAVLPPVHCPEPLGRVDTVPGMGSHRQQRNRQGRSLPQCRRGLAGFAGAGQGEEEAGLSKPKCKPLVTPSQNSASGQADAARKVGVRKRV